MSRSRYKRLWPGGVGMTLLEALVALTIFSVGVVGLVSGLAMSQRAGSEAVLLDEAILIAQRELALATARNGQDLVPQTGQAGRYRWETGYVEKGLGVVVASVRVTWEQRGRQHRFALSEAFLPQSSTAGAEGQTERGNSDAG